MVTPSRDSPAMGIAISTCGIITLPGHAVSPMGAPCAPSSVCPSIDAAISTNRTPLVGALAITTSLLLSVAPADPWHIEWRARVFLNALCRGIPRLPALQRECSGQLTTKFDEDKGAKKIP
jgi:hypothetical protein